jgi:uncharacterized protein YjdB
LAAGTCTVSATFQGITGIATLTVRDIELAAITVTPAIPTIAVGTRLQFIATALFIDGSSQDLSSTAVWASSNTAIATISSPGGLATALAPGTAVISATFQGVSGSATLTVTTAVLAAITVSPPIPTIAIGTGVQFVATGLFTDGTAQPLTTGVTWVSSDPAVASISPTGLATALAPGTAVISATFQGVSGSATLTVTTATLAAVVITPANPTMVTNTALQFIATGILTDGTEQDLTTSVTWQSSNLDVMSISDIPGSKGLATALGPIEGDNNVIISASFQGLTGTTSPVVTFGSLAALTVTPVGATIGDGTTLQFTATGLFSDGFSSDLTLSATWTSSDPTVAAIDPTAGLATALAPGSTTICATFTIEDITGYTPLTVTAAPLVQITVTPVNPTISVGTTLQFTATALFSDGTSQNVTAGTTWLSSAPTVAQFSPGGLVTALAGGTTTISATFQGVTGGTSLTVTASPLVEIAVTPINPVIGPGGTQQFTAVGIFGDGNVQNITLFATWESLDQYVATIDSGGLATAGEFFGTTTITATFQDVVGSAILSVDGYGSSIGITKMSGRFLGIIGTASLTVMLMGLFFRGRAGEGPARRQNRRE